MSSRPQSDIKQAAEWVARGHALSKRGLLEKAYLCSRSALRLDPFSSIAHNNVGYLRLALGDMVGAESSLRRALELNPRLDRARTNLAIVLVQTGRAEEAQDLWDEAGGVDATVLRVVDDLVANAMNRGDLTTAAKWAANHSAMRWGSQWYPEKNKSGAKQVTSREWASVLTIGKLEHDVEQYSYLQRLGRIGAEFTPIIKHYEACIARLRPLGVEARVPLHGEDQKALGHVYNRIVYIRDTPRVSRALSSNWSRRGAENEYIKRPPGVVVIDDFLSADALRSLRAFCMESTVWSTNRYAHGRLGSFFLDGFNCPLLLQIAEELRAELPRVIGQYPLRQVWGFKYSPIAPGNGTHADFAAVNVNFWLTPDDANRDSDSGGLVVYDVAAPRHWKFRIYNERDDIINRFLRQTRARKMTIPYRQNRAVIFNSDLFHATAPIRFRSGYENRRLNVTLLYGDRKDDFQALSEVR